MAAPLFPGAEVSRGYLRTEEGGVGDQRGPSGVRSSDTAAAGETCLCSVPAHPLPALLVSGILTPRGSSVGTPLCFKDMLNVFDIEHASQGPR